MTLQAAITALCDLQKSLQIVDPFTSKIREAYPLPPNRKQTTLPDAPCWINVWGLQEVMNWPPNRIERYSITCQLLVNDADTFVAAQMATSFATEFIKAWDETDYDLGGTVIGSELRGRDPSVVNLEWGGLSFAGIQFTVVIDVPVGLSDDGSGDNYVDDVIQTLINWTAGRLPGWQQDLNNWHPTNDSPGILWFYLQMGGPLDNEFLDFDHGLEGATVAARIVTPSRQASVLAIRKLTRMLGHDRQDHMLMPDGTWLCYDTIRSQVDATGMTEGQVQMNVKWILDETLADDVWWDPGQGPADQPGGTTDGSGDGNAFGPFPSGGGPSLLWQEDPSVGNGSGPTIKEETP